MNRASQSSKSNSSLTSRRCSSLTSLHLSTAASSRIRAAKRIVEVEKLAPTAEQSEKAHALSYSDKVQNVMTPRGHAAPLNGRFILLVPPPLQVAWAGKQYRFQVEQESVSKEWRLFAVDVECERLGSYSAYLLATSGKKADFERHLFIDGVTSESRPSFGMFRQLQRDGRAREVR